MTDTKHISKLTPKQEILAAARASGKTYEECAQEAAYSSKGNACRAVNTNENVQARIGEHLVDGMKAKDLSPEWVLERLIDLANGDKVKDGALVRTLELLGKTDRGGALFSDRVKTEVTDPRQALEEGAAIITKWAEDHNVEANRADVMLWIMGQYGISP